MLMRDTIPENTYGMLKEDWHIIYNKKQNIVSVISDFFMTCIVVHNSRTELADRSYSNCKMEVRD